ncbi:MAG: hypothetical protein Q4F57_04670 [Weeksellaceae bacterium]|nr:hypothetical protein [Weeksellaceae bacterium]
MRIEDKIRHSLESREQKPSPQAWNRLQNMLDQDQQRHVETQPKKTKNFSYAIAASLFALCALVLAFTWLYHTQSNQSVTITSQTPEPSQVHDAQSHTSVVQSSTQDITEPEIEKGNAQNSTLATAPISREVSQSPIETAKAVAQNILQPVKESTDAPGQNSLASLNETPQQIENTDDTHSSAQSVKNLTAEKMLHAALLEQQAHTTTKRDSVRNSINPRKLLTQSQKEVEQERRRPELFRMAKDEFQRLQTAVLERNYQ